MLRVGIQVKPPLLQMYILPSGPSAAPFGPPGIFATTSLRPSGKTRVRRCPRISTSTTDPSGITTGPSGNSRSVARTRTLAIKILPALLAAGGFSASPRTQHLVAAVMAKSGWLAKQASTAPRRRAALRSGAIHGVRYNRSILHRHPDLQPAIAGRGVELLVIALEVRRI